MLAEANLISESPYLTIAWSFGFAVVYGKGHGA
jgi:hypothetical protein